MHRFIFIIILLTLSVTAYSTPHAVTQPIPINDLVDFESYPSTVKTLILKANTLAKKNLTYLYGSSDPKNQGMDCSGTIYYLLKNAGVDDIPRDANAMYFWAEKNGRLMKVSNQNFHSQDMDGLKPGDLLFWKGTYATKNHSQITHVQLYLGVNKNGHPLMFGASDGRSYLGKKMWGVSVFDFNLSNGRGGDFVGYSCIPHLICQTPVKQRIKTLENTSR